MEPEGSLPHSQMPATCLYPEPAQSSPYPHILASSGYNPYLRGQGLMKKTGWFVWLILSWQKGVIGRFWLMTSTLNGLLQF
jgi:hypothetical protein